MGLENILVQVIDGKEIVFIVKKVTSSRAILRTILILFMSAAFLTSSVNLFHKAGPGATLSISFKSRHMN